MKIIPSIIERYVGKYVVTWMADKIHGAAKPHWNRHIYHRNGNAGGYHAYSP